MSYFYDDEEDEYSPAPNLQGEIGYLNAGLDYEGTPVDGLNTPVIGQKNGPSDTKNGSGTKPPRLLLMGLRRSGKSSIQKVVFHKMAPNETLFLESTSKVTKDSIASFIDFQVWDFPGQVDFFDPTFDSDAIFGEVGALVYIVDAQDDYTESLSKLHDTLVRAYHVNPDLYFEVFVHKVDGLSDDYKVDLTRDIQQRVMDELADVGLDNLIMAFYPTSIYDHSIFEALSKVLQKMIRQLPTLENLLNVLCANSGIEKAYLFDVASKVYLATDSSPIDMQSYEICSDMIDVVVDLTGIYSQIKTATPSVSGEDEGSASPSLVPAYDDAYSSIRLNSGLVLYFREINQYLALVCLVRLETFEKRGLLDHNFQCFKSAIREVLNLHYSSNIQSQQIM